MNAIHRYPGVKPFEATDVALFFGRDRDTADLFDLINREKLAVLFGKSGYGKSSLIKAALIPELLEKPAIGPDPETGDDIKIPNIPIYVRLNLYSPSKSLMPCEVVAERFREAFSGSGEDPKTAQFFKEKNLGNRLWQIFKSSNTFENQRIFLIFDQFEEFFSYPVEAQLQFRQELSELLYTQIPQQVRDSMGELDRNSKRHLHQAMDIHALFATRSDRLHLLNSMREELPAILNVRYELKALTESQASEAIVNPARLEGNDFLVKKPFTYAPAALSKILFELKKARETANQEVNIEQQIEAFQLQMVCQTIEQGLISRTKKANGLQPTIIEETDLPDFEQIYQQYYSDKLADLPSTENRAAAHILLEEEMVIGEELSEMRRVSLPKEVLVKSMHDTHKLDIEQPLFDYLEDKFLIRRETFGSNVHYEVSHDVLLGPLMKSRNAARLLKAEAEAEAIAAEHRLAEKAKAAEAEKSAKIELEKKRDAEKKKQLIGLLTATVIIGLLFASLGIWALDQKKKAVLESENARMALEALKKAEHEKSKTDFWRTINDVSIIMLSRDGCPDEIQRAKLDTVPKLYPEDPELQESVRFLQQRIKSKNCK